MDKKEIIKKYLLEGDDRKIKLRIAWDIRKYFDEILDETALNQVIFPLKEKVNDILPSNFIISYFDFGSFYITKDNWRENPRDRGIIAIALERWHRNNTDAGLVKNRAFKVKNEDIIIEKLSDKGLKSSHQWWLGRLSNVPPSLSLPLDEYYELVITNPTKIVDDYLQAIKEILDIVKDEEIFKLLEEFVKERKQQIKTQFSNKQN